MSDSIALVIGNRNYSSWSVLAWLAMKHSGLAFEEIFCPTRFTRHQSRHRQTFAKRARTCSQSRRQHCLGKHGDH